MEISITLAITIGAALAWSTASSVTPDQSLPGMRHLGFLACYVSPAVFISGFWSVAFTWLAFSVLGVVSIMLECDGKCGRIGISSFFSAIFDWPVLIPEAIECFLAKAGFLKPR